MKMKIKPKVYLFGMIFFTILSCIIASITNSCIFDNYWLLTVGCICIAAPILLFFKWYSLTNEFSLFVFLLIIISAFLPFYLSKKANNRNIERGGIIISAQIIDKWSAQYTGSEIKYVYLNDSTRNNSFTADISRKGTISKKVGDTILIIYAASCPKQSRIYKLFPSQEEVEKFKDGVFYKDGKIMEEQ